MIITMLAAAISSTITFFILFVFRDTKEKNEEMNERLKKMLNERKSYLQKPFSLSDYHERMEKIHMKLTAEREKQEPHIITLWWGFDGLRLNPDGTTEWISKKPVEEKKTETYYTPVPYQYYSPYYYQQPFMQSGYYYSSPTQSMAMQIQELQNRLAQAQANIALDEQMRLLQTRLNTNYYPAYQTGRDMNGNIVRKVWQKGGIT